MFPKLKPLAEQVIVITGASSGIGFVTAKSAAEQGAARWRRCGITANAPGRAPS